MKRYENYFSKKTQAYDLINDLHNSGFDIRLPIDVEAIYKFLEIPYKIIPDFKRMKITGCITIEENEPKVWVNPMKNTQEERKRFTLAHELGHFMLHIAPIGDMQKANSISDENISFNRDDNWDYKEMEANNFAAQLLMPATLIEEVLKEKFPKKPTLDEAVECLVSIFNVSIAAMEFRLKKLGL